MKIMQRKKLLIAVLAIALLIGTVSAVLLTYYGRITGTVTVGQAVTLDGLSWPDSAITETVSGVAGNLILGDMHTLRNRADKKIVVDLVSTDALEYDAYPEYRLDSRAQTTNIDDDSFYVQLADYIVWGDFTGISFDYLIEGSGEKWIPQTNIVLRDSEGNAKYYASWNSFRTGITGTAGARSSIMQEKDYFYFYSIPDWGLLGLYKDLSVALKSEIDGYKFRYFAIQAGDTSYTNDVQPGGVADEIVWVSKISTDTDVEGIGLMTPDSDPVQRQTEFRMVYAFVLNASEDIYTITTNVVPVGFLQK